MNNFLTLFLVSIIIVSFTIFYIPVYGDVIPPLKQYKLGFSSDDVFCKDGLIKVIKLENKKPACVLPASAEKLSKSGWATQIDQKLIEDAKIDIPKEIGTLNIIEIDPVDVSSGKFKQNPPTAGYNLVFEVCAQQTSIISPEISIRTDSEAKRFTLAVDVPANSCILSTTFVKATNTKSITAQLSSTDGVTNTILEFQQKIDEINTNLTNEKNKLNQVQGTQDSAEYKKQISQITENIIKLRKDLNDARDDLYRYQYALVAPTTSVTKTPTKLSYSGTPIEGESVKKLAVLQSLSGEGTYDVLFEACAGKDTIRIPIITVTSDITNQTVKLGEKISPNTCQKTSTKINAKDVNSIMVSSQNNLESTNKISELEGQITDLQNQINSERKLLGELIHNPKRPADFNAQLTDITQQITDLRNQILALKSQLHDLLYLNYKTS